VELTDLWRELTAAKADVVLNGHDHDYERFAQLDAGGAPSDQGIREFVVGTGGDSHYKIHTPATGSQVRIAGQYGVLELVLGDGGYDWTFRSVSGRTLDAGSTKCHGS